MLDINQKRKGMPMHYIWYAKEKQNVKGFVTYKQSLKPIGEKIEKFPTLISDLTLSQEELWAKLEKGCAYKVKRAQREGVEVEILESSQIDEKEIRDFCEFFDQFWKSKGIKQAGWQAFYEETKTYVEHKAIVFSKANIDGATVVYHTFVVDGEYARLLHSASLYRISEDRKPAIVGMANRYLHWADMLYFKEKGILKYDWGGAGKAPDVIGITAFKESFGGDLVYFYNGEAKQGLAAKSVYQLLRLRKKHRDKKIWNGKFSVRLDDITADMDFARFYQVKEILDKYGVKPLIGVVPDNQDDNLHKQEPNADFWEVVKGLQNEGWSIAQHGYQHVYETKSGGILNMNSYSEFAGLSKECQIEKLSAGKAILNQAGIYTDIFMAPAHSYDANTLEALQETGFTCVTDGYTKMPYRYQDITFVPCKTAHFGEVDGVDTFCIHTNTISEKILQELDAFLSEHRANIVSFAELRDLGYDNCVKGIPREERKTVKKKNFMRDYFGSEYIQKYMNVTNADSKAVKLGKRIICSPMLLIGVIKVWKK